MKSKKKLLLILTVMAAILLTVPTFAKPKLNRKSATIQAGKTIKLKVNGAKNKKIRWSSSNKAVVVIECKKANAAVLKGVATGTVTVKAKIGKKTLKCRVVVVDPSKNNESPNSESTDTGSSNHNESANNTEPSNHTKPTRHGTRFHKKDTNSYFGKGAPVTGVGNSLPDSAQEIEEVDRRFYFRHISDTDSSPLVTPEVVEHVRGIVENVVTPDMTPNEKLWAVFNYIGDRSVYPYMMNRIPSYNGDDWPLVYAVDMMNGGSDSHGTAALFGYAASMIDYDSHNIHWCNNGLHAWVEIDGLIYDPVYMDSPYHRAVFGYTYHEGQAADLGAGYEQMAYFSGTFRYIQVPRIR